MVQRKADRMIVSVEHSKLLKSRSLSNILNLIPDVDYDGEGGISVMGNGVKIYENGSGEAEWGTTQEIPFLFARQ